MVFTMHRLVQLTVRTWLKIYGQEEEWKERFIKNLYGEFPTGQYENWEVMVRVFANLTTLSRYLYKNSLCGAEKRSL
jgi:hypothetical protein